MSNLHQLYYETVGNRTDPCIIFIMGMGGQLIHWPPELIRCLVEKSFFVVTFDNRDSGLSPYYDHLPTPDLHEVIAAKEEGKSLQIPYTLEDMAADVIGLMDELDIKCAHIAGISMGGIIAQLIAIHYPKRILSLICIASTSGDPHLPAARRGVLKYLFAPQRQSENLDSYVNNKMKLHQIYNHPDHVDENKMRELYIKSYHRSHHSDGFKRQLLAMIVAKPRGEQLKKLHLPSLIIHGDADPAFPIEHGRQLAECIPGSQLEIVSKLGHGIPKALCERLANIIAHFLDRPYFGK